MNIEAQLLDGFKRLKASPIITIPAIVESVDQSKSTCDVFTDHGNEENSKLFNIRLRATIDNKKNGVTIFPKPGTWVLISKIGNKDSYFVSQYSEIDVITLIIGEQKLNISNEGFAINDGENGGLINIINLTEKINELIDKFNNHKHSGIVTVVSGGSGVPAVGTPGNTATPTTQANSLNSDDYQDETFVH